MSLMKKEQAIRVNYVTNGLSSGTLLASSQEFNPYLAH